ncbi:MAG TPA: TraR/DksA C4-type zinc finger protein [Bacillus sp. (in: firmicutes)]|nr:TraR/DksA C4-type zinc finger protein [Bacillus sp. (in: firmicutes)]
MGLTEIQMKQLKNRLIEMKHELTSRQQEIQLSSMDEATGELNSGLDNHMADSSTELYERQKEQTLEEADEERLNEIKEALERMVEGTYGVCVDTGEKIPFERLKALPYAKRTAKAQEEYEQGQKDGLTNEQSYAETMQELMDHDTIQGKNSLTTSSLRREQDAF